MGLATGRIYTVPRRPCGSMAIPTARRSCSRARSRSR